MHKSWLGYCRLRPEPLEFAAGITAVLLVCIGTDGVRKTCGRKNTNLLNAYMAFSSIH